MNAVFWLRYVFVFLCCLPILALAQTNFHVIATNAGWTWFNDPRAVFHGDRLHVGYVRNGDGRTVLTSYDPGTSAATTVWSSSWTERDDHNNPGLLSLQDGRLMAIYARHSSAAFFATRTSLMGNPVSSSHWGPERIVNVASNVTYANPYQLSSEGGRIYNFMRNINFNPTFVFSDNQGTNWSAPEVLIHSGTGSTRPYVKYTSDNVSRIELLYTDGHPRNVANSLYHAYYEAAAFWRTDGSLLKYFTNAPLRHDGGERGSVIYQYSDDPSSDPNAHITGGRAWCWEIVRPTNQHPACVFAVQRDNVTGPSWFDDRIYYYYARWTGTAWQKRFIAHAGRPLYEAEDDYAGGICIDPENQDTVYISSNAADPFNLGSIASVPLQSDGRYELYRGVTSDGGWTFDWTALTTNSPVDNVRPYVPRNRHGAPALIWLRGRYDTYTMFDCSIVALLTNHVFLRPSIKIENPRTGLIHLTNSTNELSLTAAATDDGMPGPLTYQWSTAGGPTNAIFADSARLATSARFPLSGTYTLRVAASDGLSTAEAFLTVYVGSLPTDASDMSRRLWLKLDENSGTNAFDSSGSMHHAAVTGGTTWLADGPRAGALAFHGSDGSATVADSLDLDNTVAFTLSFWFRLHGWPQNSALISKREGVTTANAYSMFVDGATGRLSVDVDGPNDRFLSSTTIGTGAWHHVALVFNGIAPASERAQLWIDGRLDTIAFETSGFLPHYSSKLRLANLPAVNPTWLNGAIDDVRFHRRALSQADIQALAISNAAPSVILATGPPATNRIPVMLSGSAVDDGNGGPLAVWWTQVSGPGIVAFSSSNSSTTQATFSRPGVYRLRLNASDSEVQVFQDWEMAVAPNPHLYDDWISGVFPEISDPAVVARTADPDGDGQVNFLEFAFGSNPEDKNPSRFQIQRGTDHSLRLLHPRRLDFSYVVYRVFLSLDLQHWEPAEPVLLLDSIIRPPDETGCEVLSYRVVGSPSSAFFRIAVDEPASALSNNAFSRAP